MSRMRYRGVRRAVQSATARRIEAERRRQDETADPSTITDLWAAIYRLQSRHDPAFRPRIKELGEEQRRRREDVQ